MEPTVRLPGCELWHGDCLQVMQEMAAESVHAIVCDPPYGLVEPRSGAYAGDPRTDEQKALRRGGFMGKKWDAAVPDERYWSEALRVAKPGAFLLAFGGTRTFHRLVCAIEDAGWEIRDCVIFLHAMGFPKSHDVSKAIDREAGVERERIRGVRSGVVGSTFAQDAWSKEFKDSVLSPIPATDAARRWQGWGTALKPAWEPIIVARKPFPGTVAENVQRHGTGALNIDGCRVGDNPGYKYNADTNGTTFHGEQGERIRQTSEKKGAKLIESTKGRWPANVCHDGSDEVVELFPTTDAAKSSIRGVGREANATKVYGKGDPTFDTLRGYDDNGGSAARFFFCAKASKEDRGEGNNHPTVKNHNLMKWLVRLVTPSGGVVLDCFMGSGSTGKACVAEGFRFVGIEQDANYVEIARGRIAKMIDDMANATPLFPAEPVERHEQQTLFAD